MSSPSLTKPAIFDAIIPGTGVLRDAMLITGGALFTTLGAQITIPWQPVPFTLQTLSVMLCGLTLGSRKGMLSQLLYIGLGAIGIPVFAQGKFGLQPIMGATGGYIVSFALVAAVLGWLAERNWTKTPLRTGAAMIIGSVVTLGIGAAWLSTSIGAKGALLAGVVPFLLPEAMKALVVLVALPSAWKWVREG